MIPYLLALLAVGLTVLGQLSLKSAALRKPLGDREQNRFTGAGRLGAGYAALIAAASITAYNLRALEFNVMVSLTALCYPAVLATSYFAFDERLTKRQWIGLLVICGGVILYNLD